MTKEISPMDSLKYYLGLLHAGFVSLDPQDGQIKTWVGGRNFEYFPYDHVDYSAKRQVGSVFKPLVYATALENNISPCTYYKAEQVAYEVEEGEWKPGNSGNEYDGKYSMEGALESSINTVSVKILEDVGIEKTISLAHDLGVTSNLPAVPSVALGTASISLLEMVTAYCTLTNGGYAVKPYKITSITTSDGKVLYEYKQSEKTKVIDSETSAIMVYLLQNVVNDGTARSLRSSYRLSNDIGGKTGTTQGNADGWFIGTTPKLVSGAWVGGTYPAISFRDTRLGQGATMALPIYAGFQQAMNKQPEYNNLSRAKYKGLSVQAANRVDCDPFKEDFELFTWLFGNKKQKDQDVLSGSEVKQPKEEKKFFKKIGSFFKRKKKD
jgi:penicillin-binding protein 1A